MGVACGPRCGTESARARRAIMRTSSITTTFLLLLALGGTPACIVAPAGDGEGESKHGNALDNGATYTLWIHGLDPNNTRKAGDYADWSYWGDPSQAAGSNPRAVNWDGTSRVSENNGTVR